MLGGRISLFCLNLGLVAFSVLPAKSVKAQEPIFNSSIPRHSQSDFGGVGLMQMPTARVKPTGEFSFTLSDNDLYRHYSLSLQVFPWLESNIRFTQVHDILYSYDSNFSGDNEYTDKSIDVKAILLKEGNWAPQIGVGLRDLGGTGLFDSEYFVASKQLGPIDLTIGVGWGYIANRNNIHQNQTSGACSRSNSYSGNGGSVDVSRMFSGCLSFFGGIEYQTPISGLAVKFEYDGNDYQNDFPTQRNQIAIPVSSPWNIGAVYSLSDWGHLHLSYERGNTLALGLTISTNFASLKPHWTPSPPPAYHKAESKNTLSEEEWQKVLSTVKQQAGYAEARIYQQNKTITLVGKQSKYRDDDAAASHAAVLLANTGMEAEQYRIVTANHGLNLSEKSVNRQQLEQVLTAAYPNASFKDAVVTRNPESDYGSPTSEQSSRFSYGFAPVLIQSFGGSEDFYLFAAGLRGGLEYKLKRNWLVTGSLYANIFDNYDKFNYTVPPDGTSLTRVRTLTRQYFKEDIRLSNLQLTYFTRLNTNLFVQYYGGYLESMFAGVGSEWLYRPLNTSWAFGVDINYVKQREPTSLLGLYAQENHIDEELERPYRVQTGTATGHATFYWQPQKNTILDNTLLKISVGRYLAEDVGFTFDFSKQFDSGVIAGTYVTKTNLTSDEYGEGSFTKGFYISIPFDLININPTTRRGNISWQPLTRDGGQRVGKRFSLFKETDARSPWYSKAQY
ncbi:YjbH domain-containing protein [Alteromonas lipolytica]|uniref:WbfB protein n=1 Tax=Alteromonas lipolytica TaxID=1856405 RepID=A0A1E8FKD4_9ALTE|nr:YjbH domain-containing protein [Alteromonas lipolytica]OFI36078.1 hypothetical protein BFC17_10455 [Alteromonas lipolytica]GGF71160.1 WbfB protein [Alteromonas lipolytica]